MEGKVMALHRYIYINAREVDFDLRVYSVMLGENKRDRMLVEKLMLYKRHDPNVFFEPYSMKVLDFITALAVYLRPYDVQALTFYGLNHSWINSKTFRHILGNANLSHVVNPKLFAL